MKSSTKRIILIVSIVVIVIVAIILAVSLSGPKEIPFSAIGEDSLQSLYFEGRIETLTFDGNYVVNITLKGEKTAQYYSNISSRIAFSETLSEWQAQSGNVVKVIYDDPAAASTLSSFLIPIIMLVALALLLIFIMKKSSSANNKALDFGKTKASSVSDSKVRFNDVAGADEEKQELQEIVDFLKNPLKFKEIGARIPKGVLLVGPPGTGKTLFAKAVAGEANVPFFSISGSDFVEMFVGVGASRVRDLFEQAKKNMPCIIFIDEIDAVGRQRGAGLGGGNDEREQTLNQLLVQMDGFESSDSIIVMAATNRSDILDPALMRPGRFDRQVFVNIPDVKGREEIMKVHARNKPLAGDVNFKSVARLTAGFTGADIENMLNEAAILAARDNRKAITMSDIGEAINKVIAGPAKKSRVVTASDKRITAYHESGHAIVAKCLKNCDGVHEVSIIPRGNAAGYTITLPENDNDHHTKQRLLDTIAMMLGGRAAEQIVIKDVSTGASNDLQRASNIARRMVTEWGMSETLGTMYLGSSDQVFLGRDYQTQLTYSEDVAKKIDEEVKKILDGQYKVALDTLLAHRDVMDAMVKMLFEKETIHEQEMDELFKNKGENAPAQLTQSGIVIELGCKNTAQKEGKNSKKKATVTAEPEEVKSDEGEASAESVKPDDGASAESVKPDGEAT